MVNGHCVYVNQATFAVMMLKIILMVTFMLLVPAAILTSLPDPQGSAGVVSVMVAAAGGCWAAIQLYQVIIAMMTMIMNLNRIE